MEPQTTQTAAQLISNIVSMAATIGGLSAAASIGVTEFAKKVGLSSRFAGIFSYVLGFLISSLVCKILIGAFFSPLALLISIAVAFVAPGVYSGIKAAVTPPVKE